jgi:hypothetical protein
VKRESYCLFPLLSPVFKGNDSKDIRLVKYEEKLAMICIDRENDFIEAWIMESYNGRH